MAGKQSTTGTSSGEGTTKGGEDRGNARASQNAERPSHPDTRLQTPMLNPGTKPKRPRSGEGRETITRAPNETQGGAVNITDQQQTQQMQQTSQTQQAPQTHQAPANSQRGSSNVFKKAWEKFMHRKKR
jgi:hypothetical protein